MLKNGRLYSTCREIFETPLDYLHFSLPPDQRDEELFHYYKFKYQKETQSLNSKRDPVHNKLEIVL